jgi:hypothetical protein
MQESGITVERNRAGIPEYIRFNYKKYGSMLQSMFYEKGLEFPDVDEPNKQTVNAIKELKSGKGKRFDSVEELLADCKK